MGYRRRATIRLTGERGVSETWLFAPRGPCVLCAVADPSRTAPVTKEADVLAETGRGLHVVSALADLWGCTTPSGQGKAVWAMFSTYRQPDAGPA